MFRLIPILCIDNFYLYCKVVDSLLVAVVKTSCEYNWWSWSTSLTLGWDNPYCRDIFPEILRGSGLTGAVWCHLYWQVSIESASNLHSQVPSVTYSAPWRRRFSCRNTFAYGRCMSEYRNDYCREMVPGWLLVTPGLSACRIIRLVCVRVYSLIIRPQLWLVMRCVLSTRFIVMTNNIAEKCVSLFNGDVYFERLKSF